MMKKHLAILTFLFTLMFSSTSFAEWTKLGENLTGDSFYLDVNRIRKVDDYIYYWTLNDYLKPTKYGHLSAKVYFQADCKLYRMKALSFSYYKETMGGGTAETNNPQNPEWQYPQPQSILEGTLKIACDM